MRLKPLFFLFFTHAAIASPWFTGPLLAPSGRTIPAGHVNFEPYGFYTVYPKDFRNIEGVPILSVGLLSFLDIQAALPYDYSWDKNLHGNGIGDQAIAVGFQALRQKENSWIPDLRIVIQEVFPTGRFENLDPEKVGTDQTGLGSYQTYLSFNFQKLFTLHNDHYLRTRLSATGGKYSDISVHGVNTFGGSPTTRGKVKLENSYTVDLSFEYTLTQNWVPVFEVLYAHNPDSNFFGNPGLAPDGTLAGIAGKGRESVALTPALEYNFTPTLGVIGGVWFFVTGPSSAQFVSGVFAVNYYF